MLFRSNEHPAETLEYNPNYQMPTVYAIDVSDDERSESRAYETSMRRAHWGAAEQSDPLIDDPFPDVDWDNGGNYNDEEYEEVMNARNDEPSGSIEEILDEIFNRTRNNETARLLDPQDAVTDADDARGQMNDPGPVSDSACEPEANSEENDRADSRGFISSTSPICCESYALNSINLG